MHTLRQYWLLLPLLVLVAFPALWKLGDNSVRRWDEGRNAANAAEMYFNHNYLVRHYEKVPDMYETKPPLLIWLQVLSFKCFGISEWSLRLPSALAIIGTCALLFWFLAVKQRQLYAGLIAPLILVTSNKFMVYHGARTGDHEALLIFCITGLLISGYLFLSERRSGYVIAATLFLTAGSLTKSIAPLMLMPGLVLFICLDSKSHRVFADKRLYLAFLSYAAIVVSYYLLRDHYNPGYIKTVWMEELFPRFMRDSANKEDTGFWLYAVKMEEGQFGVWPLLCLLFLYPAFRNKQTRHVTAYLSVNMLLFFLVVSSGNKNVWYDYPLVPMMAMLTALGIVCFWQYLLPVSKFVPVVAAVSVTALCTVQYRNMIDTIRDDGSQDDAAMLYPHFIKSLQHTAYAKDHIRLVDYGVTPHFRYYEVVANKVWKINTDFRYPADSLKPGYTVMTSYENLPKYITPRFAADTLAKYKDCLLLRLKPQQQADSVILLSGLHSRCEH